MRLLLETGKGHDETVQVAAEVGWAVYRKMARIPWLLSGVVSHNPRGRLAISTRMFRTFPFGSPAYLWRDKVASDGVVVFDCLRCPVAEYFAANKLGSLCVHTCCNLDFALAKEWGAELQRTGSIAGGAAICDFRWKTIPLQEYSGHVVRCGARREFRVHPEYGSRNNALGGQRPFSRVLLARSPQRQQPSSGGQFHTGDNEQEVPERPLGHLTSIIKKGTSDDPHQ